MSNREFDIGEIILEKEIELGEIEIDIMEVEPELEDIEITPTGKEQKFKSSKYGYNEITVKAVDGETLEVTPTIQEQSYTGLFDNVNVKGIESEEISITPSTEEQVKEGMFNKVTVKATEENAIFDGSLASSTNTSSANSCMLNRMLKKIPLEKIDTSAWTSTVYLFYNCTNLTELPDVDTSSSKWTTYMYGNCRKLEKLSELDGSKNVNASNMFSICSALVDFGGFKDFGEAFTQKTTNYSNYRLSLSSSTKLTHESLMNVINKLYDLNLSYDVANEGTLYTQSLQIGSTNKAKLTAEEIRNCHC